MIQGILRWGVLYVAGKPVAHVLVSEDVFDLGRDLGAFWGL